VTALDADAFAGGLRAAGMPGGVVRRCAARALAMDQGRLPRSP
jgi:hypothetical protein